MKKLTATTRDIKDLKGLKRINLQLFADDEQAGDEQIGGENKVQADQEKKPTKKTYTQEEFEKALQSEADKRVTQAIETSKKKWEEEEKAKLKVQQAEAEKLAKMTAEEKNQAKFDKMMAEVEEKQRALDRANLEIEVRKTLKEENLDESFAGFLMGEDAETSSNNIKNFKEVFGKAVGMAVKEQLKGSAPPAGGNGKNSLLTREQIQKMSEEEINKNWELVQKSLSQIQ